MKPVERGIGRIDNSAEKAEYFHRKKSKRKGLAEDISENLSAGASEKKRFGNDLAKDLTNKPRKRKAERFSNGLKLRIAKGKNPEYYDPNNSENPLLEIREKDLDKKISKHFKVKDYARIDAKDLEFVKPGTYWTVKSGDQVEYYRKYARIDPKLVHLVETIRNDAGVPMVVDEGFRPYGENKRMYLARGGGDHFNSKHVSGQALDFKNTDSEILKSALYLMRNGGGIGLYAGKNAIHFDCRVSKRRWDPAQWDKKKEWPTSRWLSKSDVQEVRDRIAGKHKKKKRK